MVKGRQVQTVQSVAIMDDIVQSKAESKQNPTSSGQQHLIYKQQINTVGMDIYISSQLCKTSQTTLILSCG